MQIIAKTSVRVAPRKVRLVADLLRKLSLEDALATISLLNKRAASPLEKTLKSAIANAVNNAKQKQEDLNLKSIEVQEAPSYKRYHPSTRGRIHPYKRRGSNITIILETKLKDDKQVKLETKDKKGETNGAKS